MNWHTRHKRSLTFGQIAADKLRNLMGSWAFVLGFIVFMLFWAWLNTDYLRHPFDEFPFILLNLFLSMLAGLQGAILLIAAKRQDETSAALAQHDYETNVEAKDRIEEHYRLSEAQDAKLDAILDALHDRKKAKAKRR